MTDDKIVVTIILDEYGTPIYDFISQLIPGQYPFEPIGVLRTVKKVAGHKGAPKHHKLCVGEKNTRTMQVLNGKMAKSKDPQHEQYFPDAFLQLKAKPTETTMESGWTVRFGPADGKQIEPENLS